MMIYLDTTTLNGFPITVRGYIQEGDSSVGMASGGIAESVTLRNGKRCPFIEKRMKRADWDALAEEIEMEWDRQDEYAREYAAELRADR